MGTIICQNCSETIEQFEHEKVSTLYGQCNCCDKEKEKGSK
ncbi:MAG TPA: GapA-binding peptide SR1P [Bacillus sp. (in: firmicutes)]|nr:GapA-binding peptide SR1P [Bacillus sp. (in: firmicutes)]